LIGIDLVKVERIESMISKFGSKALKKFLNDDEILLTNNKPNTISGFYAAKEAFSKAIKVGISKHCSFFDIEIKKDKRGAPFLSLSEKIKNKFDIKETSLSITHDGGFAIAVCAVETNKG
jgi:holo-[acyl-carrier protein] synthase